MKLNAIFISVIIILLLILIVPYCFSESEPVDVRDYLTGFWLADGDEFCRRAEIDSMLLYISAPEKRPSRLKPALFRKSEHDGWLIINPNISNQKLELEIGRLTFLGDQKFEAPLKTDFEDKIAGDDGIWPEHTTLKIDMSRGVIYIYKDDDIYARLYKSNELNDI